MSKRVLSLVLALVMVLGTFGTVFAAATTPTGNAKVDKLIEIGLVKGYGDGTYGLDKAITRAEVATMVVRALDLEEVAGASVAFPSQFSDMNSANVLWARGYVNVAAGQGIVNGYPNGTFLPAGNISYAEAAAMLVRVLGGLTEAEAKTAVWPTTYLAKAAQLGVFTDVEGVVDYNAPALREKLLEMVFNTLTVGSDLLVASTVEGIVVENYRTESLDKDEVVIHVMKDQIARSSSEKNENTKYYEESDEFKVVVTPELVEKGVDVETLLGKVVKISFDKDNKVVGVQINENYQYLKGKLTDVTSKDLEVNDKEYTVVKNESRATSDERLYQVYLNNEDIKYEELEKEAEADYANITVRNGKVLFIDAYEFEDVAPVAKDIDSKDKVAYYDDAEDGDVRTLEVDEDAYVINFVDGEMRLGNYKDISANDVIHWYESAKEQLTVIVRPEEDNKVEGKYTEASAARAKDAADIKIMVDKEEYKAYIDENDDDNRDAVYSISSAEDEYHVLTEDYDDELEPFEKEEVTVLRDIFGYVQLISAEKVDGKFYAMISNTSRSKGEIRLVKSDDSNEWYETDRDTKFANVVKGSKDKQFDAFGIGDVVLATVKDNVITEIEFIENADGATPEVIEKITKDIVDFGSGDYKYTSKKTVVFVAIDDKTPKGMTVADFVKNYNTSKAMEGYAVENEKDTKLADVIVITAATSKKDTDKYETLVVKVDRVRFSGKVYRLDVIDADGEKATYYVPEELNDMLKDEEIVKGSIIEIDVPKNADKDGNKEIDVMEELVDELAPIFEVVDFGANTSRRERFIVLEDKNGKQETVWISRTGDVFGTYKKGSFVAIQKLDKYDTTFVVDVRTGKNDKAATADWANFKADTEETPADKLAEAKKAVEKAQDTKLPADIAAARKLVDALPASADKDALLKDLLAITPVVITGVKASGKVTTQGVDFKEAIPEEHAEIEIYSDLKLVAKEAGKAGNQITIAVKQLTGKNQEFGVVVTGNDIVVNLGTDAAANPVAVKETEVATAISAKASELVVVTGGKATDAAVQSIVALAGGVDKVDKVDAVAEVYTLTVTSGAAVDGKLDVNGTEVIVTAGMTAAEVAQAISTKFDASGYTEDVDGAKVVFTATIAEAKTDLDIKVVDK